MTSSKWKLAAMLIVVSAVVGVVGWQQFSPQPRPSLTTTTPTMTTASSTQTIRTFKLTGVIFFDYNGNGRQEKNEPPIPDATVALNGANLTTTNATGWYRITEVTQGLHRLRVFPPKKFRYMCESVAEFRPVQGYYNVILRNDTRKDIGLMEGFLTLPVISKRNLIANYFDHHKGPGVRNHNGDTTYFTPGMLETNPNASGTEDEHLGHDFNVPIGTPIVAAAPGIINWAQPISSRLGDILHVTIDHKNCTDFGENTLMQTGYGHLDRILVKFGEKVDRYQVIGISGKSGSSWPHLHFSCTVAFREMSKIVKVISIDPFFDLFYGDGSDNTSPVNTNLWTRFNSPQTLATEMVGQETTTQFFVQSSEKQICCDTERRLCRS